MITGYHSSMKSLVIFVLAVEVCGMIRAIAKTREFDYFKRMESIVVFLEDGSVLIMMSFGPV